MKYLGRRTAWARIIDPDGEKPIPHFHWCPCCCKDHPCHGDCTLDPRLDRDDGAPRGASVTCPACSRPAWTYGTGIRVYLNSGAASGTTCYTTPIYVYSA